MNQPDTMQAKNVRIVMARENAMKLKVHMTSIMKKLWVKIGIMPDVKNAANTKIKYKRISGYIPEFFYKKNWAFQPSLSYMY